MQAEGFEALLPFEKFNKMGYLEVILHLPFFFKAKKFLIDAMKTRKPKALICVDYYGFNLEIMKVAHSMNIPVIWYIVPKIWARKSKKRLTNLVSYSSHIATIFPFEAELFLPYTQNVSFVGNPLVEFIDTKNYSMPNRDLDDLRKKESISLALVPGSRNHEVQHCLPIMVDVAILLRQTYPNLVFKVSRCEHVQTDMYKTAIGDLPVEFADGPLEELFAASDLAIITSGTATLQAALMGIPMVIVYKISAITFAIFKMMVSDIKYAGLPNIIADKEVVPELLQSKMKTQAIGEIVKRYIERPEVYTKTKNTLAGMKESLGSKKPSLEMTQIIKKIAGIQGDKL